eukprot:m.231173 g.231173  ORF g.231173 m.231173 type:complete len:384 (-) comp19265_c0_seq3:237-1388(-)
MMTSTLSPSTESESCDTSLTIAYLSAPVIFFISLALGCTLSRDDVHAVAHQKRAVLIGWVSQFGFMPLITYAIARIFDYNALLAIGCILCGCAPGGTTSNVFTYWSRGNVALSIVMSIASTVCAFFMVPLCILIYVESTYHNDDVSISYSSLAISLLLIVVPCAGGVFLRFKNTKRKIRGRFLWEWCESIGSAIGLLFIVVILVFAFVTNADLLDSGPDVWIPALLLEPLGCGFGYMLATLGRLDRRSRRAVSLETGVQNYTFAIAVISLTWKDDCDAQDTALVFPYIATIAYGINSIWICTFYRFYMAPNDPAPAALVAAEEMSDGKMRCMLHVTDLDTISVVRTRGNEGVPQPDGCGTDTHASRETPARSGEGVEARSSVV